MKFSIFFRGRFNPQIIVGGYELCIDRDGILVMTPRRSFGFIRKSGFWHKKVEGR